MVGSSLVWRNAYLVMRRVTDLLVVLLALPAIAVILSLCSLAILLLMGRPVFFAQKRVGLRGRPFLMYKLRTMSVATSGVATAKNDPRVTPLGRWLRVAHVDELPQILNILKGEMTLIGPRPEQLELVEHYKEIIPDYDTRHLVKPGLSGLSQVSYGYAATVEETRRKLEYDLHYVEKFGPVMDMQIIVRTFAVYANPFYCR